MNQRDLTVVAGAIKQQAAYTCLLTGRTCGLVPVTLRRMLIFPPIWIGWRAVVVLPLEKTPTLAPWQYARMLRPYAVILVLGLGPPFSGKPGSPLAIGLGLAVLAAAVALWITLGRLLDKFEFVRLLRYSNSMGTATVRFSTASLAHKASEVLVYPYEVDSSSVLTSQRTSEPRARPVFRRMAGGVAVVAFIVAVGIAIGANEVDAWMGVFVALAIGLLMGAIALGKQ